MSSLFSLHPFYCHRYHITRLPKLFTHIIRDRRQREREKIEAESDIINCRLLFFPRSVLHSLLPPSPSALPFFFFFFLPSFHSPFIILFRVPVPDYSPVQYSFHYPSPHFLSSLISRKRLPWTLSRMSK